MGLSASWVGTLHFCFELYHKVFFGGRRLLSDVVSLKKAGLGTYLNLRGRLHYHMGPTSAHV